ncbi:hypothetical protein [Paludibacterium denitrificans]|nr:hypothetical protein [Paludibacterium denitrificans]
MLYRKLGHTGLEVSLIGLGTMTGANKIPKPKHTASLITHWSAAST